MSRLVETLTEGETLFCHSIQGLTGSFFTSLINTMMLADFINIRKLMLGFPDLGEVVWRYKNEPNYWQDLVRRWNSLNPHSKIENALI